jgi:hypothetical protein
VSGFVNRGSPLMDYRRLLHQPTAQNKLICGWTVLVFQAMQSASRG